MFATAEKSSHSSLQLKAQNATPAFFRKAGEGDFFAKSEQPAFFGNTVQPKLEVSSPDDPQEKEADAMADKVMRMAEPAAPATPAKEEEKLQRSEEEEVQAMTEGQGIARKCNNCQEAEEKVQAKSFTGIQRSEEPAGSAAIETEDSGEGIAIDRKPISMHRSDLIQLSGRGPPAGLPHMSFQQNLSSSKGGGSALPQTTRTFMESRFDADFGGVRIHTGETAQQLSQTIHAQAFTHGNDIYFNQGKYNPDSASGGNLLAHELTHTLQQGASQPKSQASTPSTPGVSRKIQRAVAGVPVQLANAVEKAKTVEGKIDANKPQADGNRTGYEHLLEIFKTTFGEEMIVRNGGSAVKGAVAEDDIKKKRIQDGVMVVDTTTRTDRTSAMGTKTGSRDAMPSWCGIFVFWALNKSGVPMPKWKLGERMIPLEAARAPGAMPMPGDIAYRNAFSHFAMVESVNGGTVKTVNGNTAGEDNLGGQVQTIEHPLSEWSAFFNPLQVMTGSLGDGEQAGSPEPKTIGELRNENEIQPKVEEQEQEAGEKVQTKPELSTWNVDSKGSLQTDTMVRKMASQEPSPEEKNIVEDEQPEKDPAGKIQKQAELASLPRGPPHNGQYNIQRSPIDTALSYTSLGELMDCVYVTDVNRTSVCLLRKASAIAMHIPGYKALRVVLGRDPISGETVQRNGRNFLEAAFDIMPGGALLQQKLEQNEQLERAANWIDTKIAGLEAIVDDLFTQFDAFWNGLGISDFGSPMGVIRQGAGIVYGFISNLVTFAIDAAKEILGMIKDYLLSKIVEFIKEQTTAYPLLTVILGEDPITKVPVARNGTNILNAILELGGEEGRQQRTQMQETGTFAKAAGYIDEGIEVFSDLYNSITNGFAAVWDIVTIQALMNPIATFQKIYNVFARPVARVLDFMLRVGREILKLIKDVLMQRLSAWARTVRGYALVTVLIGRDPFTGENVPRTIPNIIRGFMSLMDGGEEQYQQMVESGAIARTTQRINAAVARLNMTPAGVIQLFIDLWNSFSINDLVNPISAFQRIIATFGEPIARLIAFVVEIVKIVVVVILEIMNFPFDLINNIIRRTIAAFHRIKNDPIGFLKNLLRAIKQGFIQFFDNILTHLMNGVVGWLMAELRDANVPAPTDFSLRGIIGWVLQVLGISMDAIWAKLAAHPRIGPERVARLRSMIDTLEGIWTFIRDVQERGIAAIWERIQEQLSNLWNTVLDAVKNWIMERIVTQVTARLLSMLDPTGIMAVVNSAIAIFNAIQSFIRYLRQMLEVINSFVNGVADIAEGNVTTAANYLERTMGSAMPIVVGFLANQVGLSGVGRRIAEIITSVRELVDRALTWLVNRAVDTGFAIFDRLMSMGRSAVSAVRSAISNWFGLRKNFATQDGQTHSLYFTGSATNATLMVASNPTPYTTFLNNVQIDPADDQAAQKQQAKTIALRLAGEVEVIKQRRVTGANDAETTANENAKTRAVVEKIDELSTHTAILFGVTLPICGEPVHVPSADSTTSFGIMASIKPLTRRGHSVLQGTPPTDTPHQVYDVLALRRGGGSTYYKKGHLLNQELKGVGTWKNLTPLTTQANSTHEGQVEAIVKAALDTGAIIEYIVRPVYSGRRSDKQALKAAMESANVGSLEVKKRIVDAEDQVPTALECRAWRLNEALARVQPIVNITILNTVARGVDDYEVDGESHFSQVTIDFSVDRESKMITYGNINPSLARLIVNARNNQPGGRFTTYLQMADIVTAAVAQPELREDYRGQILSWQNNTQYKLYPR